MQVSQGLLGQSSKMGFQLDWPVKDSTAKV
jgi:hypothetical protein